MDNISNQSEHQRARSSDVVMDDDNSSNDDDNTAALAAAETISPQEARLDCELEILHKMRQAFASALLMFESARDDLNELGERMDRLRSVSQACRTKLLERQRTQQAQDGDSKKRAAPR